jgi:F0F1-type ATP synthase assembly protein I
MPYVNWAFRDRRPIFARHFFTELVIMSTSRSPMQQLAPYMALGGQLSGTVLVCTALGWWIDTILASEPIGIVSGALLGSIVGLTQFLRTVRRMTHAQGADKTQER